MFKNMKLGTKLLVSFLGVGVIPFSIIAIVALLNSSKALSDQAFNQLNAVQAIKKAQIESFFQERLGDVSVLSGNPTVSEALQAFSQAFEKDGNRVNGENWQQAEDSYADWLVQYNKEYGYYDLFLINSSGDVVYSVEKESDLGENLVEGSLKSSGLAAVFDKSKAGISFADFEPYSPSGNKPASFVAAPVRENGRIIGTIGLQIPLQAINTIMQQRDGMGKTGETYLVGSDKLMRSDSYLDPTNHSVVASFANPSKGRVDTEASRRALSGEKNAKIISDYNGNPVLSSFSPLQIGTTTWACIAEIDKAEAFATIVALEWIIGIVALIAIGAIVAIALFITRSITKPINVIIDNLGNGAGQVASASEQLASSSQSMSQGASEQASSLEEVSSSLEEMASMTKQNAENAKQANIMSTNANTAADESKNAMNQMNNAINLIKTSSDETAKIIKTIDEIAMQTNLLALNAAVEAARAGEAGRGFAVVAEEVRNLAPRSAEAAKNTSDLIEGSQKNAENGVTASTAVTESLEKIIESIQKASQLISEVSAASDEQSQGIDQVNSAVAQMDTVTQQNAANSEESASASEELSSQAQNLNAMVDELISIVNGASHYDRVQGGPSLSQPSPRPSHSKPVISKQKTGNHGLITHGTNGGIDSGKGNITHMGNKNKTQYANSREVDPEKVLPLGDDKDLMDF